MSVEVARVRALRRIVTPEGVPIPFEIAPGGDRASAFCLDFLIVTVGTIGLWVLGALSFSAGGLAFAMLGSFFLRNFYFVYMEMRWGGATLGKRLLGLRVIARDGGPLTAEAIFARNLTRDLEVFLPLIALLNPSLIVPSGPGWGRVLSILWLLVFSLLPLFNRDRLRVGDIIGGTLVVKAPRVPLLEDLAEELPPESVLSRRQDPYSFTAAQLDLYGIHELQVLEEVLRGSERPEQQELLERVCEKIKQKIEWPQDRWEVDPEAFLRAFYKAQRARLEHRMLLGDRRERKRR